MDSFVAGELNLDLGAYIASTPDKSSAVETGLPPDWAGPAEEAEQPFQYEDPADGGGPLGHVAARAAPDVAVAVAAHTADPVRTAITVDKECSHVAGVVGVTRAEESNRSLGVWRFDKKKKKRYDMHSAVNHL